MSGGHKSLFPGKRCVVRLSDGRMVVDRFLGGTDARKTFETLGTVPTRLIRSISPYKGEPKSGKKP